MDSNSKYLGVEPYIYFRFSRPGIENDIFIKKNSPLKIKDCSWVEFEKVEERAKWKYLSQTAKQELKKKEESALKWWNDNHVLFIRDYKLLVCGELVAKGEIVEILPNDNNWIRVQLRHRYYDTVFYCRKIIYRKGIPYAVETRTWLPFVNNLNPAFQVGEREIYCLGDNTFEVLPEDGLIEVDYNVVQYRDQLGKPVLDECYVDFYDRGIVNIHGEKTTKTEKNYRGEEWTYIDGYSSKGRAYIRNEAEYEFYKCAYCDFAKEKNCQISKEKDFTRISFTFALLDELNEKHKGDKDYKIIGSKLERINEKY